MRVMVIGATGTIGRAVVAALGFGHEVIQVSRQTSAERVDIADPSSIKALCRRIGEVDAVIGSLDGRQTGVVIEAA